MKLHLKHKILITVSLALALVFANLFVLATLQLRALRSQEADTEHYLQDEEAVVIIEQYSQPPTEPGGATTTEERRVVLPVQPVLFEYIEVVDSCAHNFSGECLNVRSGPGKEFPVVSRLRNGVILKVDGQVDRNGMTWYKIVFDEWIRYPNRVTGDWYVAAPYVAVLLDEGVQDLYDGDTEPPETVTKRIEVDRSEQMLYAYDGDDLYMQTNISTGIELTPTPRGTFTIFRKTPSRYMQGPLPGISSKYWDLPGVPWNLYFTHSGAVLHGTYWHNNFGSPSSNGCVNLRPDDAEKLYKWAEIGTQVIVRD